MRLVVVRDGAHECGAVSLHVLDEQEQQLDGRLGHLRVLGAEQRVQPLNGTLAAHHALHAVDVQHDLAERYAPQHNT